LRANKLKIIVSGERGKKNLKKAFEQLETKFGIKKILVEGGGR